jgi:hypothetical protein
VRQPRRRVRYWTFVVPLAVPLLFDMSGSDPANAPDGATLAVNVKVTGPAALHVTVQRLLATTLTPMGMPELLIVIGELLWVHAGSLTSRSVITVGTLLVGPQLTMVTLPETVKEAVRATEAGGVTTVLVTRMSAGFAGAAVGVGVGVGPGMAVGVGVGAAVINGVGVGVGEAVGTGVGVAEGVGAGVGVGVGAGVGVGVDVGAGVGPGSRTGVADGVAVAAAGGHQ